MAQPAREGLAGRRQDPAFQCRVRRQQAAHGRDADPIVRLNPLIVAAIGKEQRQDTEIHQVRRMDPFDAERQDQAHAQIQWTDRRVFARRALPVTLPGNDDPDAARITHGNGAFRKRRLPRNREPVKHDAGILRNIAAQFQEASGRHDVVRGDLVIQPDQNRTLESIRQRRHPGRLADGRLANNGDLGSGGGRCRDHAVVNLEFRGHGPGNRRGFQLPRIADAAVKRRGHRRFRTDQVATVVGSAGATAEIAVEGAHRGAVRCRTEPLPDARAAGGFEYPSAGLDHSRQGAVRSQHCQNLAAARRNPE